MWKNVLITGALALTSFLISAGVVNESLSAQIDLEPEKTFVPQAEFLEQLTPTDGRVYETNEVAFQWRKDSTSEHYWVWVTDYYTQKHISVKWHKPDQICEGMTCTATEILPYGDYKWRVGGWDTANAYGPYDEMGEDFHVGPVIQTSTPSEDYTLTSTQNWGVFTWEHNASLSWYGIYVGQPNMPGKLQWFEATTICSSGVCKADMHLAVVKNGIYQFWLAGYDPIKQQIGPWGLARKFNVDLDTPGLARNIKHTVDKSIPTLIWEHDPTVGYYRVYIGTSNYKTTWFMKWLRNDENLCKNTVCSLKLPYAFFDGQYAAWIQAWNPGGFNIGNKDSWSGPYNFTMDTGFKASLRQLAKDRNLYIGAALNTTRFVNKDVNHNSIVSREFNMLTPENAMKWESIRPSQNEYDFTVPDQMMRFAEEHDMEVRGHVLVWYNQNPKWLVDGFNNGTYTKAQVQKFMEDHIKKVIGHYGDRIQSWDVVNEAFDTNNLMRTDSIWHKVYEGDAYIAKAFQFAREADPNMLLYYNDFNIEGPGIRTDKIYDMLKGLKDKGVPIDGVGMQGHVKAEVPLTQQQVVDTMRRFAGLGLRVGLTEIDVRIADVSGTREEKYKLQAEVYAKLLRACLEVGPSVCDTYGVWGISDADSWIPGWFDNKPDWPLLYDEDFKEKPAYHALVDVFTEG